MNHVLLGHQHQSRLRDVQCVRQGLTHGRDSQTVILAHQARTHSRTQARVQNAKLVPLPSKALQNVKFVWQELSLLGTLVFALIVWQGHIRSNKRVHVSLAKLELFLYRSQTDAVNVPLDFLHQELPPTASHAVQAPFRMRELNHVPTVLQGVTRSETLPRTA